MLITYDTEFLDDGETIELISIGLVDDRGGEFYGINADADWSMISNQPWLAENVLSHLPGEWMGQDKPWKCFLPGGEHVYDHAVLAMQVECFLKDRGGPDDVELWADYPATDHVALYQLFGPMIECTKHGMPMRTSCLVQEEESLLRRFRQSLRVETLSERLQADWDEGRPIQPPGTQHHALWDARQHMEVARWLGLAK